MKKVFAWMLLGDDRNLVAAMVRGVTRYNGLKAETGPTRHTTGDPDMLRLELINISKQYPAVKAQRLGEPAGAAG